MFYLLITDYSLGNLDFQKYRNWLLCYQWLNRLGKIVQNIVSGESAGTRVEKGSYFMVAEQRIRISNVIKLPCCSIYVYSFASST